MTSSAGVVGEDWFQMGQAAEKAGDKEAAKRAYEKAVSLLAAGAGHQA